VQLWKILYLYLFILSLSLSQMSSNTDLISYATGFEHCNRVIIVDFLSLNSLFGCIQTSGLRTWLMSWDDTKLEFTQANCLCKQRCCESHGYAWHMTFVKPSSYVQNVVRHDALQECAPKMRRILPQYVLHENKFLIRFEGYSAFLQTSFNIEISTRYL